MIRIFITDDHAIIRQGLKNLIVNEPDMMVAGESSNGRETLRAISQEEFDLLLLDVNLPDMDGLEVLHRVKLEHPRLPVLMFTLHMDETMAVRFMKAGASGCLVKDMPLDQILDAIRKVVQGGKYLAPSLAAEVAGKLHSRTGTLPHEALSDREFTIFLKIAAGISLARIAKELNLSPNTISTYRTRVLEKMLVSSNAELVRYALTHHLIS